MQAYDARMIAVEAQRETARLEQVALNLLLLCTVIISDSLGSLLPHLPSFRHQVLISDYFDYLTNPFVQLLAATTGKQIERFDASGRAVATSSDAFGVTRTYGGDSGNVEFPYKRISTRTGEIQ